MDFSVPEAGDLGELGDWAEPPGKLEKKNTTKLASARTKSKHLAPHGFDQT